MAVRKKIFNLIRRREFSGPTGHPIRAKYLDKALARIRQRDAVWIATGSQIFDWYRRAGDTV